jgi:hypothetical protein
MPPGTSGIGDLIAAMPLRPVDTGFPVGLLFIHELAARQALAQ